MGDALKVPCPYCKKSYVLRRDGNLPRHTISITGWVNHPEGTYAHRSPKRKVVIAKKVCPMSGLSPEGARMPIHPNARCKRVWQKKGEDQKSGNFADSARDALGWLEEQKADPQIVWARIEDYGTGEIYAEYKR